MPTLPSYDLATITELLRPLRSLERGDETSAHAAVAVILRARAPGDVVEVFLIERAVRAGDPWSGHMAFPGGRRDARDPSTQATAVRETFEEVGFDLVRDATLLARLPDVVAASREEGLHMVVAPYVFALHGDVSARANHEVADTLWTPLAPLARGDVLGTFPFTWRGQLHELPCFTLGQRTVWGLTYWMFERLFEALHA